MLRALTVALLSLLCASTIASAEEPTVDDPKAAIAERGFVLKAGKRHLVVVVPATTLPRGVPPDSKLRDAEVYFGDAKKLFRMLSSGIKHDPGHEDFDIADPRDLFDTKLRAMQSATSSRARTGSATTSEHSHSPPLMRRPSRRSPRRPSSR